MATPHSASSQQRLMSRSNTDPVRQNPNNLMRDPTTASANDVTLNKVLAKNKEVNEETFLKVDLENPELVRAAKRSELASKRTCLTQRWQTALVAGIVLVVLAGAIGKSKYSREEILFYSKCYSKVVWLIG